MTDVLSTLSKFTWRGYVYPVMSRRASFRHEGVKHTIQYRNFDFVEQLGAHDLTFHYRIPLRQNISRGPYRQMFAEGYPRLFQDMLDRTPGTLFDPVANRTFRCTPNAWDDETNPLKRDGTEVEIEFIYTPELTEEDPELLQFQSVSGLTSDAGALDREIQRAEWEQEVPPEPSIDALQAANGVISQGLAQVGKASASLHNFAYQMEQLEATCDRAENPQNWGIRDAARRNREAAIRLNRRLAENPATKLRNVTMRSLTLLGDLAKEVGMTLEELLRLNPSLARLPYVRPGQVVIVRAPNQAA